MTGENTCMERLRSPFSKNGDGTKNRLNNWIGIRRRIERQYHTGSLECAYSAVGRISAIPMTVKCTNGDACEKHHQHQRSDDDLRYIPARSRHILHMSIW